MHGACSLFTALTFWNILELWYLTTSTISAYGNSGQLLCKRRPGITLLWYPLEYSVVTGSGAFQKSLPLVDTWSSQVGRPICDVLRRSVVTNGGRWDTLEQFCTYQNRHGTSSVSHEWRWLIFKVFWFLGYIRNETVVFWYSGALDFNLTPRCVVGYIRYIARWMKRFALIYSAVCVN